MLRLRLQGYGGSGPPHTGHHFRRRHACRRIDLSIDTSTADRIDASLDEPTVITCPVPSPVPASEGAVFRRTFDYWGRHATLCHVLDTCLCEPFDIPCPDASHRTAGAGAAFRRTSR